MEISRSAGRIILGGVVLLTIGMAIAILGVVTTPLFFPGVFGIVGGLVVIAAGTIVRAAGGDANE